ncbi:MAG: trimethylamine methyltransferase family protein [Sedimentisphaerales bacterium]|nr:trimethylamine methyltransferase family protein [Sedimentisphaerales bacterium]
MARIRLAFLSDAELQAIHEASLQILRDTGVKVHHDEILALLGQAGAKIDAAGRIARFGEQLVMDSIELAQKQYVLYGRDPAQTARFGYGDLVLMSSPGQFAWIDEQTGLRRAATVDDARDAIRLGDALANIHIVGAMAQPESVSETVRDVFLTGELVKHTGKPTRCWVRNGKTARYILEIYRTIAGGAQALRDRPMVEAFLEPISPLQLPGDGLEVVREFAQAGQPVSIGPMAMASATAPATLAGTLAQENAEILAGVVVTQLLAPGTAITYGGIPHIMDLRTSICSFGSPEQGVMAVAMVQMAKRYGFPVYVNVGLTDAKIPDGQAGAEKASTLLLGVLAGADTFGHCGICGTDHAGSLLWLAFDSEVMSYVSRVARGFDVDAETLATDVVGQVGPAGNFLAEEHTVRHFRQELWLPGPVWTRQSWDEWDSGGRRSMADRLREQVTQTLRGHEPEPLSDEATKEVDAIVDAAWREMG